MPNLKLPTVVFVTKRQLKAGEELFYDYGGYNTTDLPSDHWLLSCAAP